MNGMTWTPREQIRLLEKEVSRLKGEVTRLKGEEHRIGKETWVAQASGKLRIERRQGGERRFTPLHLDRRASDPRRCSDMAWGNRRNDRRVVTHGRRTGGQRRS